MLIVRINDVPALFVIILVSPCCKNVRIVVVMVIAGKVLAYAVKGSFHSTRRACARYHFVHGNVLEMDNVLQLVMVKVLFVNVMQVSMDETAHLVIARPIATRHTVRVTQQVQNVYVLSLRWEDMPVKPAQDVSLFV